MDYIFSLIVAIAAGVACHYIIKWLDGDKQSVTSLWFKPPYPKTEQKAPGTAIPGAFTCCLNHYGTIFSLA